LGLTWALRKPGNVIEMVGRAVVQTLHQMAVSVHGDLDRGVSEAGLNGLRVLACSDQPGRMSMSEIVNATGLTDGLGYSFAPDPAE
jgi:hypothetical protein